MATFKAGQRCECLFQGQWFPGQILRVFSTPQGAVCSFQYRADGLVSNNVRPDRLRDLPDMFTPPRGESGRLKQSRSHDKRSEQVTPSRSGNKKQSRCHDKLVEEPEGPPVKQSRVEREAKREEQEDCDDMTAPPPYDDVLTQPRVSVLVQLGQSQKLVLLPVGGEQAIRAALAEQGYNESTALIQCYNEDYQAWIDLDSSMSLSNKSKIRLIVRDLPTSLQSLLAEKTKAFEQARDAAKEVKVSHESAIAVLEQEISACEKQRDTLQAQVSVLNKTLTAKIEFQDVAAQLAAIENLTAVLQDFRK